MKRYMAKKEEVETTSEIGKICGFICTDGRKGYLVFVGEGHKLSAVLVDDGCSVPNISCGSHENNTFASVDDFVQNANKKFSSYGVAVEVNEIYFFDTLKEMHKWLSE